MNKLSLVFCLFVSILAPASSFAFSSTHAPDSTEIVENESTKASDMLLLPVGFDKVLTLISTSAEQTDIKVEILDESDHIKYASQYSTMEVVEIDLSRLTGGTYLVKISQGDYVQLERIILP